jgi:hypothetical protein
MVLDALPLKRLAYGSTAARITAAVRAMRQPEEALAFREPLDAAADELARVRQLEAAWYAASEASRVDTQQRVNDAYDVLVRPVGERGEYSPQSPSERWYATPDGARRVRCVLDVYDVAGSPTLVGETDDGQPIYEGATRTLVHEAEELPLIGAVIAWAHEARTQSAELAALAAEEPEARAAMERAETEYEAAAAANNSAAADAAVEAARVAYYDALNAWSAEMERLLAAMQPARR